MKFFIRLFCKHEYQELNRRPMLFNSEIYIFCPKCHKEDIVPLDDWKAMQKKKEILDELRGKKK
jgi:hypothetical protein